MPREQPINLHQITGGACRKLSDQCPHTACRFNLTAEHRDNRGAKSAERHLPMVREACALDAAEIGGMTHEEIASRLSLTRERVRQIEFAALSKLWLRLGGKKSEATISTAGVRRCSRMAA